MDHPQLPNAVQSPSLAAWEKKFCIKVGAMPWKRFAESKNSLFKTDKVFEWDNSAGLKAF
ncbi:hypothetical protein Godav_029221 [Gossypium davidsonii]|uniref:Uncharacterized protein n=1 Tax=Gossypium davidsonii TaxID=34287 RepID=A0A7J8TB17_GOSDV|nr:hypothetical protein [Gossypium davidsonii]